MSAAAAIEDVTNGHPMYLNIAFPYLRPKQATYAREVFQGIIKDVIDAEDLDLEVNPRTVCTCAMVELAPADVWLDSSH